MRFRHNTSSFSWAFGFRLQWTPYEVDLIADFATHQWRLTLWEAR